MSRAVVESEGNINYKKDENIFHPYIMDMKLTWDDMCRQGWTGDGIVDRWEPTFLMWSGPKTKKPKKDYKKWMGEKKKLGQRAAASTRRARLWATTHAM